MAEDQPDTTEGVEYDIDVEDLDTDSDKTILEKLNENPDLMMAMMDMPTVMNEAMVQDRREQAFEVFWDAGDMEKEEVLRLVKAREQDFLESLEDNEDADTLPEWLLRMEAQDTLVKVIHKKFEEEGLI